MRRVLPLFLALCLLFVASAALAGPSAVSQGRYYGYGDPPACGLPGTNGVGRVCFDILPGATQVSASIAAHDGMTMMGYYVFQPGGDVGRFCGSADLDIPAGATRLEISVQDPALGIACTFLIGLNGGIMGTIFAAWS